MVITPGPGSTSAARSTPENRPTRASSRNSDAVSVQIRQESVAAGELGALDLALSSADLAALTEAIRAGAAAGARYDASQLALMAGQRAQRLAARKVPELDGVAIESRMAPWLRSTKASSN
jgi:hypothetical protein